MGRPHRAVQAAPAKSTTTGGIARLFAPVESLKGIGPNGVVQLTRLLSPIRPGGAVFIPRVRDLLFHLPVDLRMRTLAIRYGEIEPGTQTLVRAVVLNHQPADRENGRRQPHRILCHSPDDPNEILHLVFFHGSAVQWRRQYPEGARLLVGGRSERYHGHLQIAHPDLSMPDPGDGAALPPEPIYPMTEGLTQSRLRKWIETALGQIDGLPDWLSTATRERHGWPLFGDALATIHHPAERADLLPANPARERLAYDEALAKQTALLLVRGFERRYAAPELDLRGLHAAKFLKLLPFDLTGGQKKVLADMADDLASGTAMLRLLQGDVGSGKTIVAFLAMLAAVDSGRQAAIMAPTTILARQHYRQMKAWGEALGIEVALMVGSLKGAERQAVQGRIASGTARIVVGTHALFQKDIAFDDLALAVIDEQHRFGVLQRIALTEKARERHAVHLLLMTATPIPRSLTLTVYGDLDSSELREKPPGRQTIVTKAVPLSREAEVIERLHAAVGSGARVYWICPLVGDAESESDYQEATKRHAHLASLFPGQAGLVHGRMTSDERERAMNDFASGVTRILVATTVIEVGIDVPEASVIVIENAERFGLSQLHQLRGRVGRGQVASSCLLLYGEPLSQAGKDRLQAIRDHDDGFVIAEEDLRLRGGGEMFGTRQSGLPEFRFLDLAQHGDLIREARQDAAYRLERDPRLKSPDGKALVSLLHLFGHDRSVELVRSG